MIMIIIFIIITIFYTTTRNTRIVVITIICFLQAAACGLAVRTLLILLDGFGLVAKGCGMERTVGHRV